MTDTVLIYRVEDEDGFGAYRTGIRSKIESLGLDLPTFYEDFPSKHPTPTEDGIHLGEFGIDHFFGFKSEGQLRDWFFPQDHDAEVLDKLGFQVKVYSVDEDLVVFGGRQVVFVKSKAHLVATLDPLHFQ